jgi:hypothetical protein
MAEDILQKGRILKCVIFCMSLYILVWYNGSLQLFLQFLVPIHVMPNANEVIHYLENFLMSNGTWLRPFHNDVRIFLIFLSGSLIMVSS